MIEQHYLADVIRRFRDLKRLGDGAVAQVSDADLFRRLDAESNSIALIMKHVAGNMRSRWTDFLTSDGEKSDRNRDAEFEDSGDDSRESIAGAWEAGWQLLYSVLDSLKPDQLAETVTIRGEPHLVLDAIDRQLAHYAYHVGQIVFLAKHFASDRWTSLSVPRRRSGQGTPGAAPRSVS